MKMVVIQQLLKFDLGERDGLTWEGMIANSVSLVHGMEQYRFGTASIRGGAGGVQG